MRIRNNILFFLSILAICQCQGQIRSKEKGVPEDREYFTTQLIDANGLPIFRNSIKRIPDDVNAYFAVDYSNGKIEMFRKVFIVRGAENKPFSIILTRTKKGYRSGVQRGKNFINSVQSGPVMGSEVFAPIILLIAGVPVIIETTKGLFGGIAQSVIPGAKDDILLETECSYYQYDSDGRLTEITVFASCDRRKKIMRRFYLYQDKEVTPFRNHVEFFPQ